MEYNIIFYYILSFYNLVKAYPIRYSGNDVIAYRDNKYEFGRKDGIIYLDADGECFYLYSHGYEPCMYILADNHAEITVHNSFEPYLLIDAFRHEENTSSITGKEYSPKDICDTIAYAVGHFTNTDISCIEKAMEAKRFKIR